MKQLSNAKVKLIRSLQQKKYRSQYKCYVLEGFKAISTVVKAGHPPEYLIAETGRLDLCRQWDLVPDFMVESQVMSSLSTHTSPAGILGLWSIPDPKPLTTLNPAAPVLMLDRIHDPGNLGTIIRTLDWFGWHRLLLNRGCCDVYNSKTLQAAMGSHVNVAIHYMEIEDVTSQWPEAQIVGLDMDGKLPQELLSVLDKKATIFVIGSESHGLSSAMRDKLHFTLSIPGSKDRLAESLNAAQVATVLMYHLGLR